MRGQHLLALQFDTRDLPHPHTGDLHGGALADSAGLGEICRIAAATIEEGQLVVVQGTQDDGGQHRQTDCADHQLVALCERFHRGVHLPVLCPAAFT